MAINSLKKTPPTFLVFLSNVVQVIKSPCAGLPGFVLQDFSLRDFSLQNLRLKDYGLRHTGLQHTGLQRINRGNCRG